MKRAGYLLGVTLFVASLSITASAATCTWTGAGADSQWATGTNWSGCTGGGAPAAADQVVLDNSTVAGSYTVNLPTGAVATTVNKLTITPGVGNTITLLLPIGNTSTGGFTAGDNTASTDDIILNDGATLKNSSGAASGTPVTVVSTTNGTLRINNGGRYLHNSLRGATTGLADRLSTVAGTELGTFEFDVPFAAADFSPSGSGRNYGNLTLSRTSGTANNYTMSGGSALTVRGNVTINTGATLVTTMTGALNLSGNLTNNGGAVTYTSQLANLNGTAGQTISGSGAITFSGLTVNDATGVTVSRDITVNGTLTLTSGNVTVTGINILAIGSAGTVSRTSGHVIGNLRKAFAAAANKTFEVGTANGYSPVAVNATAGTFPADFTISATQTAHPSVNGATSLQRYWTLTNTTISSADLTFQYLPGDPLGTEANYKVIRISGGTAVAFPSSTVNTGADTASVTGVTSFSDWTAGENVSPTAENGLVSGTITDSNGAAVEGAVVNLSGAQNRKTISNAKGYYQFDNVETTGFYTATPSRANYSFSPSARSFSQLGNHTDAAFTGLSSGDNLNPLNTPEYFVRQQYVDVLGREPDEGGFNYWSNEILKCGSDTACVNARRRDVAAAFFIEDEFQDSGSYIYDAYKGALGRKPVFSEYSADRKKVIGGPTLDTQKAAFADSFVQRAEFVQKYQGNTTADSFVDALLATASQSSGVDLSSQRASLITEYQSGGNMNESRSLVVQELADNAALKEAEYNAAFVLTEYFSYLQRNPEPEGYDFWLNVVNNGDVGNYRGMVCSFITSTEYQKRFSSVVTHSNAECGQ